MNRKTVIFYLFFIFILLVSCDLNIDPEVLSSPNSSEIIKQGMHYEFISFLLPFISGFACLIGGFILTILGFNGNISWIVEVSGFTSKLTNATPGIILMIVGLLIILNKKFEVNISKKSVKTKNPWKIATVTMLILLFILALFIVIKTYCFK